MDTLPARMSVEELSSVINLITGTVIHLAKTGQLPVTLQEAASAVRALGYTDTGYQTSQERPRGFNLLKVKNKKLGFVYYVRYYHGGKMLSSKWCTHTNLHEKACEFAVKNRHIIIPRYLCNKNGGEAEQFFRDFYDPESQIYQNASLRNKIGEQRRKRLQSIIGNKFIPFLRERNILSLDQITPPLLSDFQDFMLKKGLMAYCVNDQMVAVTKAFRYLARKGILPNNPCLNLEPLPEEPGEKGTHGCYKIDKLKGVFDKEWGDTKSMLLNLLIYTTNMRNGEIKRFRKKDIVLIEDCYFIDIKKSKTENGVRLVPLHKRVHEILLDYAKGMDDDTPIFAHTSNYQFEKAYLELGRMMGVSKESLRGEKISFYSGRHYWKTLMSSEGLGADAEEIFMGHKVTNNVRELYDHKDKRGEEMKARKARQVFEILDRCIFDTEP